MARLSALHFYPERITWIGLFVLGFGFFLVFSSLFLMPTVESPYIAYKTRHFEKQPEPYEFSLGLNDQPPMLPLPDLNGAMTFSFDPLRPDQVTGGKRLMVRIQKSAETRKVFLPCRLDLAYDGKILVFAKDSSPLWVELSLSERDLIESQAFIRTVDGDKIAVGIDRFQAGESPVQSIHEFPEESPYRILAGSKWWGKDKFHPDTSGERIEFPNGPLLELNSKEWLVFREGKWEKSLKVDSELPIAHIQLNTPTGLILEGWDSNGHVRLNVPYAALPPSKIKAEDLFTSVRFRSEKQISCMMDKQCLVLKVSDWVLKTTSRWKVLRKQEEKDAYFRGELLGELFVFDQISQRQGQKLVLGRLFNPRRTQMEKIELAATGNRKNHGNQRGKI